MIYSILQLIKYTPMNQEKSVRHSENLHGLHFILTSLGFYNMLADWRIIYCSESWKGEEEKYLSRVSFPHLLRLYSVCLTGECGQFQSVLFTITSSDVRKSTSWTAPFRPIQVKLLLNAPVCKKIHITLDCKGSESSFLLVCSQEPSQEFHLFTISTYMTAAHTQRPTQQSPAGQYIATIRWQ